MPKHDEDMGNIGKKNIVVQLGLVRVELTQRKIKKHLCSLKKHTFCQCACWSAARRTSGYKIKNGSISLWKIALPCCRDRAPPCDIGWSHSPINLKMLDDSGRGGGGHNVGVFLCVLLVLFAVLCTKWRLVITCCVALSFRWLYIYFFNQRGPKSNHHILIRLECEKILRTFFLSPLVFKLLSCSKNRSTCVGIGMNWNQ